MNTVKNRVCRSIDKKLLDISNKMTFYSKITRNTVVLLLLQDDLTPPSSAPPVYTPPQIPECLLDDDSAQIDGNHSYYYTVSSLFQSLIYNKCTRISLTCTHYRIARRKAGSKRNFCHKSVEKPKGSLWFTV